MSKIVRFFRGKSHREKHEDRDDDPQQFPERDHHGRYSLRESRKHPHPSQQQQNPYVNTIMDPETWTKPSAPYRILTEPRTKRPIQSCPGGMQQPNTSKPPSGYRSGARKDLSTHFEQEMSPIGSSVPSRPTTSSNWPQNESLHRKPHQRAGNVVNAYRPRTHADRTLQNSTSEYGSADPSPTMPFPHGQGGGAGGGGREGDDTSFTDGDSDTDSAMPAHLIRHYEKEMRKLKRKARDYKEKAITYKDEVHHYRQMMKELYDRLEHYEDGLQREQNISRHLNIRLRQANQEISELKRLLAAQQGHASRNLCANCAYSGAGEAMCSRTELHMNSPNLNFGQLNQMGQMSQMGSQMQNPMAGMSNPMNNPLNMIPENSLFSPRFSHNNDSADEIKNFRTIESGSERDPDQNENIEPARDASTNSYLLVDQENSFNKRAPIQLQEDSRHEVSTQILSIPSHADYENLKLHFGQNREELADDTIQVSVTNVELDDQEQNRSSMTSSTMTPMRMRRSFSDTDLNALAQMSLEQNTSSPMVQNGKPPRRPVTPMHRFGSGSLTYRRGRKFRALSTSDDTSSFSTDDEDLMRVIEKQLKRKVGAGDVVRFRPPRKAVTKKFFSRFGPNERKALEQFEYLHDLTTDISGLGSPSPSPKP